MNKNKLIMVDFIVMLTVVMFAFTSQNDNDLNKKKNDNKKEEVKEIISERLKIDDFLAEISIS